MTDLSILIPARNEQFLNNTIQDILDHSEADTEIIVTLDGAWPLEPLPDRERVRLLYHPVSVGQRAATNDACRLARGKYVMKLDAHCSVGQGFDRILIEDMAGHDDWIMVPKMYNLHVFDWVCQSCGARKYQGPTPERCWNCDGGPVEREMQWHAKPSPCTTAMRFDRDLKFQYWSGYKKQQDGDLVETMSLLGACWMLTRERYWELNICDEGHGSWGQQGTEVACKAWLSGGKLICNKRTWFAHTFRTQGGDWGFPFPLSGNDVERARAYSRHLWRPEAPDEMPRWDKAVRPLRWLLDHFAPVPDWDDVPSPSPAETDESKPPEPEPIVVTGHSEKAIVYYTDNRLDPAIMRACQKQLLRSDLPIVCVSLQPIEGFAHNIVVEGERGALTMFRQILAGLESITASVIFLCEHDVIYHPSHFEFTPERPDLYYYNQNVWKVDARTGRALFHYSNHLSQLCANRDLLLQHYRERVRRVERDGWSQRIGFEPGGHSRKERIDDYQYDTWMSAIPNIDLRHGGNLTKTRWNRDEFRNQRYTQGWTVAEEVPGWGRTMGRIEQILVEIASGT